MNEEIENKIEEIAEEHSPRVAIEALKESEIDSEKDAEDVVKDILPTTKGRGKRSMKYCLRCNPYWNGSYGDNETEAIGKHFVEDKPDISQSITGWEGLCYECCHALINIGENIIPLSGNEDMDIFKNQKDEEEDEVEHECENPTWRKESLVTEDGGFDWVKCEECGIYGKRFLGEDIEVVGFEKR